MIPSQFPLMILAELRKIFTRGSGIATLVVSFVLGAVVVAGIWRFQGAIQMSSNGSPMAAVAQMTGIEAAGTALAARNFFILPMFLLLVVAGSVAGEWNDQTLRELLVRPVARTAVLWAKLIAFAVLSLLSLLLTFIPSFSAGLLLMGAPEGETLMQAVTSLLSGFAVSFLTDMCWISIGMMVSLHVRSAGAVVVGVVFFLGLDAALRAFLWVLDKVGVASADTLRMFTLSYGLDAWSGWKEGWEWQRFLSLALLLIFSHFWTLARFRRMDVP